MHRTNRLWWERCKKKYSKHFSKDSKVLEVGSRYINGAIRDFFSIEEWIGIDWLDGKNVDIVTLAHEFESDTRFDTIVSASMLEHDPHWEKSLKNSMLHMKEDGILIFSWQAARSKPHGKRYAPDKKYHALKAELVFNYLEKIGMYVHEFHYEKNLFSEGTWGPVCIVAFKDEKFSTGEKYIEDFLKEDKGV